MSHPDPTVDPAEALPEDQVDIVEQILDDAYQKELQEDREHLQSIQQEEYRERNAPGNL